MAPASTKVLPSSLQVSFESNPELGLARTNPNAFLQKALVRYQKEVQGYECTFYKRELVQGRMTPLQKIAVRFRDKPFSVFMRWEQNAELVERVLFVKGQNDDMALVKPAGLLQLFVPGHVRREVSGPDSVRVSRRRLDQFGFGNILNGILSVNRKAKDLGDLQFSYQGTSTIDGRPTLVFERILPDKPEYPERKLVLHIDSDWWLPTATFFYNLDDQLLGQYVLTDVKLNPRQTDTDFTAKTCGL